MQFRASGIRADHHGEFLTGEASRGSEEAQAFCAAYRAASISLVDCSTMRIEPVILAVDHMEKRGFRSIQEAERQPEMAAGVFKLLNRSCGPFDRLALIPPRILAGEGFPNNFSSMLPVVASDIAAALAPECNSADVLGWTESEILRLSVSCVLARAMEQLEWDQTEAGRTYHEACAAATARLMEDRYNRSNGEALFVSENPGLVSLINLISATARVRQPLKTPADASDIVAEAEDVLAEAMMALDGHVQVSVPV
jgi:hypothetical protein